MKLLSIILLSIFSLQVQAQQKAKDIAEARAKMQAMAAKMSGNQSKSPGKITYSVNEKIYTETNGISTVIINGEIGDITNDKHTVSLGDGMTHPFKVGVKYPCKLIKLIVDGLPYARRSKDNMVTITFYNGKSIKGKFSGTVYNEQTKKTLSVSGNFELSNITTI